MVINTYPRSTSTLSHALLYQKQDQLEHKNAEHHTRVSLLKSKDKLKQINAIDAELLIDFPKLAIDAAVAHIKSPPNTWGHTTVNSKRVLSDLGASVFSMLFKVPDMKQQAPEQQKHFLSLIEEIERYIFEVSAMPNNENELHEDMRKHKKFIQESIDDIEFLEKYFGIIKLSPSAIINFKKLRPVILEMDASGERF